ncbi:hypothetical protein BH10PSE3_BH10PSE3_11000 [soil metagenome]
MSRPRIAVVTDSLSPNFYFPLWYRYYANQFGARSINLITLAGEAGAFAGYQLGSLRETPSSYDDNDRLAATGQLVAELLQTHDWVVRVDTDEFIVADPQRHSSLVDYISTTTLPYVSARGFDVFQHTGEAPLDLTRPILGQQRNFAFALTAMNKTCITSQPLSWDRGFHMTQYPPVLDELYLFHLKRADIGMQIKWNEFMAVRIENDPFIKSYYETPIESIQGFHNSLSMRACVEGPDALDRRDYNMKFLANVHSDEITGLLRYDHDIEYSNVKIPSSFLGII